MNAVAEVNFAVTDLTIACREALLTLGVGHDTGTTSGPMYGAYVIPLKSSCGTVRDKDLGDLQLSDFDGHVPVAVTWGTPFLDEGGEPYVLASRVSFVPTGHDTIGSQGITGVAIVGSDSVTLMGARDLPQAFTVTETRPLYLDITLSLGTPTNQA